MWKICFFGLACCKKCTLITGLNSCTHPGICALSVCFCWYGKLSSEFYWSLEISNYYTLIISQLAALTLYWLWAGMTGLVSSLASGLPLVAVNNPNTVINFNLVIPSQWFPSDIQKHHVSNTEELNTKSCTVTSSCRCPIKKDWMGAW